MIDQIKKGKLNRAAGKRFELKVRADLEKNGWIVFRNSNDVQEIKSKNPFEWEGGCAFKQTTGHWNPFTRTIMMSQSGFPDFICIKEGLFDTPMGIKMRLTPPAFEIQFVECKGGDKKHKYLSAKEKAKVEWIKNNLKIPVLIANKGKKRGEIEYVN
jgi:hypothetical protein